MYLSIGTLFIHIIYYRVLIKNNNKHVEILRHIIRPYNIS